MVRKSAKTQDQWKKKDLPFQMNETHTEILSSKLKEFFDSGNNFVGSNSSGV